MSVTVVEPGRLAIPPCDHCAHWPESACHWCGEPGQPSEVLVSDFACHQCGAEVEDDELVREMAADPEMVVVCQSCARKVWVAIGLVPGDSDDETDLQERRRPSRS